MTSSRGLSRVLLVVCLVALAGCAGASLGDPAPDTGSTPDTGAATDGGADVAAANGSLEVHFVNVGQSVSTLVVGPDGETMLVDTGHYNDDGEHVLEYLRRHDITRIDHLVTTHNDADHIGGNAAIIDYYETEADGIGAVYDPGIAASTRTYGEYLDAIEAHDVTLYETREGDSIAFGEVDVDVLGPPEPYLENEARNENSVVLKIAHGETSFVLSGDAEDDQEAYLVETYGDELRSTVLKAGHHGSSSSSSEAFVDAVDPRVAVVSSAYDSQYGHPHEEVLRRFADRSVPTYWTATHGDVVFVSDGANVSVRTQRDAPTEPLSLRDGDPVGPGAGGDVVERARIGGGGAVAVTDGGDDADGSGGSDDETAADSNRTLAVAAINADAAGDDRENLNDEYVVFENAGDETLDLSGWTVEDEAGKRYEMPDGVTLAPGETLTLRTGSGTDTETDLYWGAGSPVWNNGGDTVIVENATGDRVLAESYE
ncbi:competence protein [Halorubrum sp. Ib24]|uniref:lamin tail domain-containing protein n=1 Tax=unclassified Halorubrum TaxID=2642239 RepID=UPI000B98D44F|nr:MULTISPECIES: lamin tail domain-containing protein [unclassified Halorubrum]OYR42346.1 competence protein [Halorubrum sp. Ib24]OYR49589.1 competence protein [Halorubrum sp. Eb13]OYR51108.1 competence protein [Halorubrum sp. Ea1]